MYQNKLIQNRLFRTQYLNLTGFGELKKISQQMCIGRRGTGDDELPAKEIILWIRHILMVDNGAAI